MRLTRTLALLALFTATGCRNTYVAPKGPMPPNTMLLSQMMRDLSAQPGFTEALLKEVDGGKKQGTALMTPALIDELRKRILGKDWQGLDRFPGWTMRAINPTVRVAGHFAGKDEKLEDTSAVHPGSPANTADTRQYLDIGPYALDKAETVSLEQPSTLPPFSTQGLVTPLGDGVTRGDGPNDLAPEHADSQRLADALNRLAANKLDGVAPFAVWKAPGALDVEQRDAAVDGPVPNRLKREAHTPEELIHDLQSTGHTVTVDDARYFANFGHFHYSARGTSRPAQDVMMPFWIDSGIDIPHSASLFHRPRHLLIPASHAEYEWHIHGPVINADISYYFGIDGKSEWRTMDTLDQPWVMERNAHEYTGAQAVEVTRLASALTVAYMHQHARRPRLPFGGYYALGVCQDGVSAIERRLTGHVTLFPNTVDASLFDDPRDPEVNDMMANIPKDRSGAPPSPERIFGSLPVAPTAGNSPFDTVTIPGLAADLNSTYAAWKAGTLGKEPAPDLILLDVVGLVIFSFLLIQRIRSKRRARY
jgi:hypothetical protein